ncbi:hypothetical protein KC952_03085 [Candidatus Saccharibacteria bacterium]|nr:hypothetical protein [Candidatus Saccharibacteria bacterium]
MTNTLTHDLEPQDVADVGEELSGIIREINNGGKIDEELVHRLAEAAWRLLEYCEQLDIPLTEQNMYGIGYAFDKTGDKKPAEKVLGKSDLAPSNSLATIALSYALNNNLPFNESLEVVSETTEQARSSSTSGHNLGPEYDWLFDESIERWITIRTYPNTPEAWDYFAKHVRSRNLKRNNLISDDTPRRRYLGGIANFLAHKR